MQTYENDVLKDDTLVLGYLEQSGVQERLARDGVTEVAINRPFEIWTETSSDGCYVKKPPGYRWIYANIWQIPWRFTITGS